MTFSRFSLVLCTWGLLQCGGQDPTLFTCADGTQSTHCVPTSCVDGIKNGKETDVDCGGPICFQCTADKACVAGTDCDSGMCKANRCTAPPLGSCTDTNLGLCGDYGSGWTANLAMLNCHGTYAAAMCPTAMRVGSCTFAIAGLSFLYRYYSPTNTTSTAMSACAVFPGSTFTPN
jgi:hypothetical protein